VTLSYPTLLILAAPLGLAISQSISSRILYGIGRLRLFARLVMAEAVANLLLSVALVPWLGIEGVALGTAIPNVVCNLAVAVYVCRVVGVGVGTYARRSFLAPLLLSAALGLAWLAVVSWAMPAGWLDFVLVGGLGTAAYGVAVVLVEFGPRTVLARLALLGRKPILAREGHEPAAL